jgi:membrane dipeptidase
MDRNRISAEAKGSLRAGVTIAIDRRGVILGGGAAVVAMALPSGAEAAWSHRQYARSIVIDGLGSLDDPYADPVPELMPPSLAEALRRSGTTAFHITIGISVGSGEGEFFGTVKIIALYDRFIEANPATLLKVSTAADILRAKAEGKAGLIFGFQGATVIGEDLDRIAMFRALGVRIIQLTYNTRNALGDGCLEPANGGLSNLGRKFIQRLEQEKILLDLSHAGQRTIMEGIAASTRPLLITHTGCRSLYDHPRNVWDRDLKALANKGGVVGIYWTQFLTPTNLATGTDVIRHMTHAMNVCGEDHVAIGTDGMLDHRIIDDKYRAFQLQVYKDRTAQGIAAPGEAPGVFNVIHEWDGPDRFRLLADGLAAAGWRERQIDKVLGGNLLRVYKEGWGD